MVGEEDKNTDEEMCTSDGQDVVNCEPKKTVPSTKDDMVGLRVCTRATVQVDVGVAKVVAGEVVQSVAANEETNMRAQEYVGGDQLDTAPSTGDGVVGLQVEKELSVQVDAGVSKVVVDEVTQPEGGSIVANEEKSLHGAYAEYGDSHLQTLIENIVSEGRTPQLHGQNLDSVTGPMSVPPNLQTTQVCKTHNMTQSFGVPSIYNVWPVQSASLMIAERKAGDCVRELVSHASLFRSLTKVGGPALIRVTSVDGIDGVGNVEVDGGRGRTVDGEELTVDQEGSDRMDTSEVDADRVNETKEPLKDGAGEGEPMHICVEDSSPPPIRPAHSPSEMETALANAIRSSPRNTPANLFPDTNPGMFELFKKTLSVDESFLHISQDKYDLDNTFFLDLAECQKWISTKSTPRLRRHGLLTTIDKDKVRWDEDLTKFVTVPGQTWLDEVHTIYAPMIWDNRHWVGLAIHLAARYVQVLDPMPSLYADRKLVNLMGPVVDMLPHILWKFCPSPTQKLTNKPFTLLE
ncbi:unnamed protein product [Microthlaspi erraticum]|uniref:Ubiquitin-like protease family profile domain-containing protein n=1 Tax=Microthlaspi erraticum TaxID=1685480 RepID=A0A6D2I8B0_9BRAS|nr:unnamed protein product [Microthlaspi erraticum]CAA7022919.1 unnamed protein product [Microthlaspi erraticum]